jgi:hypothetical protein
MTPKQTNVDSTGKPKSLVAKVAEAMDAIGGIEKKGKNERQGYKYVKAADVAKSFRHELFRRGVILTADEKELIERSVETNGGGRMNFVTLKTEYTLRDADSDATISGCAYGQAMDSGDKAVWKAKTGALKYFLRELGIVPDEKDDPEADESVDEATAEPKDKQGARVAEFQIRAFEAACVEHGKTQQQVTDYLTIRFSATKIAELSRGDFADAIKWAMNREPLAETLKQSVQSIKSKRTEGSNGAAAGD